MILRSTTLKTLSANAMQSAGQKPCVRGAFFATQFPHPIWKIAAMIGRGSQGVQLLESECVSKKKWRTLEPKCSFKMGRFFLNPLSFGSQGLGGWKGDDSSSSPLRAESLFASTRTKFLIEILGKKSFEIFMILLLDHSSCPIGPDVVVWYCHTPSYLGSLEA